MQFGLWGAVGTPHFVLLGCLALNTGKTDRLKTNWDRFTYSPAPELWLVIAYWLPFSAELTSQTLPDA
jgi:hypothetical protein